MTPKQVADYLVARRRECRTKRGRNCPVCGHSDGHCVAMPDGSAALCPKADGTGGVRRYGEYGWLYLLSTGLNTMDVAMLPPVERQRTRSPAELHTVWAPRARHWWQHAGQEVSRLAAILGVATWALDELRVGWDGKAWTFPERNGAGLIVGVSRRFEDGAKRCAKGSGRGLTYSDTWDSNPGPVLLVEGGSDTAAALTLGLCVVGRPSNIGGKAYLKQLLGKCDRKIVVIGERDKKEDGRWPGVDGMKSTAMELSKVVGRSVAARLMPDGAKDFRAWLNGLKIDVSHRGICFANGAKLLELFA